MIDQTTTLRLLFPQWQGGDNPAYHFGARMLDWLAPATGGPVEEVDVTRPDGTPLANENGIVGRSAVLAQARDARRRIEKHRPDRLVVLGGDCGVDLAPFSYLNERYDGDLAVLWIDAHSDMLSARFFANSHAHVLGTLLGEGEEDFRALVPRPVKPGHALLAGRLPLPEAFGPVRESEEEAIERRGVVTVGPDALKRSSEPVLDWLRAIGARHLAVHFDLDVLDPSRFRSLLFANPGKGAPETEGVPTGELGTDDVVRLLADVSREVDIVGLGITEHVPWDAIALRRMLGALPLLGGTPPAG